MAPFIATQQQNIRRELAYIAGVDIYLQGCYGGLVVYLLT
jgi:hypothetical protein